MKTIPQTNQDDKQLMQSLQRFKQQYQLGALLKACNAYKTKGYSAIRVFIAVFSTIFSQRSMYMSLLTAKAVDCFNKDTVYRFLNSTSINWMKFTALLASKISTNDIIPLTDEHRKNVFIIDNTLFDRSRARRIELLSKVYDHCSRKYKKGFRLLTLGWSDGNTF